MSSRPYNLHSLDVSSRMLCGELCQPQTVEIVTGFHKSTVRLSVQVVNGVPNVEPVGVYTKQDPGIRRFQITVQPLWNPLDRRRGGVSFFRTGGS